MTIYESQCDHTLMLTLQMQPRESRFMAKRSHMVSATLSIAVPLVLFFGVKMHDRGVLSFRNALLLLAIALGLSWLAALSMWNAWLKKMHN